MSVRCPYICCIPGFLSLGIQGVVNSISNISMFTMAYQIKCMVNKISRGSACGRLSPSPMGYQISLFFIYTIHSAIGNFCFNGCFLCSVFFIISQVTSTSPVMVVSNAITTNMTVMMASTSMGLAAALDQ